jgi:hypothetical protein
MTYTRNSQRKSYKWPISKYMKYSTSLVIKEMQIKTTLRFNLTPVRMAIIKGNKKFLQECGKTGKLLHCWWECKLVQTLWKALWRFLKKLEVELLYDPVLFLPGTVILPFLTSQVAWDNKHTPLHLSHSLR